MHALRVLVSAGALLAACLTTWNPDPALAQCSYPALADLVPVAVGTSPSFFSFDQQPAYWTAVGVVPESGTDWDISVWDDTYAYPGCVTSLLAGSAYGGSVVDFVVGDFNYNDPGVHYVEVNRYSGTGNAAVQWTATGGLMLVNGALTQVPFTPGTPVLRIWDVYLVAGQTYTCQVYSYGGAAASLLLFRNEGQAGCWQGRSVAQIETTSEVNYTAPASGYYGLVLVDGSGLGGGALAGVWACPPPVPLASGVSVSSMLATNWYSFNQQERYWTAIALRNDTYSILRVDRSFDGTPPITCLADELASSSPGYGSVGIVVGDFNTMSPGTFYASAIHSLNLPAHRGTTQWDGDGEVMFLNGPLVHGAMGPDDLVRVWDVFLEAGHTYHFTFDPAGHNLHLLLFRNTLGGEFWHGRYPHEFEVNADVDYTAPASGWYGLVVAHDEQADGTYAVGVGTCQTPAPLVAGSPYLTSQAYNYLVFTQQENYWTAIGVRGSSEWEIQAYRHGGGSAFPVCFSDPIALSNGLPPAVDFVVGDFNYNPLGTYHVLPWLFGGEGSGIGEVEWDAGADQIGVNGPTIARVTDGSTVLEAWDVPLTAGVPYGIRFVPQGPAVHTLFVFENPGSNELWAGRSQAVLQTAGPVTYTPLHTGWHGVVVVNENGGSGGFHLRIDNPPVAVEPEAPAATAFRGVGPNPSQRGVRLEFALHAAGEVAFDVHDMTGRRVAALPGRAWNAGIWSEEWEGRSANHERMSAGVYFIRMKVDGRVVGTRRVTLVE